MSHKTLEAFHHLENLYTKFAERYGHHNDHLIVSKSVIDAEELLSRVINPGSDPNELVGSLRKSIAKVIEIAEGDIVSHVKEIARIFPKDSSEYRSLFVGNSMVEGRYEVEFLLESFRQSLLDLERSDFYAPNYPTTNLEMLHVNLRRFLDRYISFRSPLANFIFDSNRPVLETWNSCKSFRKEILVSANIKLLERISLQSDTYCLIHPYFLTKIFDEILFNAAKHASGSSLEVSMRAELGSLYIRFNQSLARGSKQMSGLSEIVTFVKNFGGYWNSSGVGKFPYIIDIKVAEKKYDMMERGIIFLFNEDEKEDAVSFSSFIENISLPIWSVKHWGQFLNAIRGLPSDAMFSILIHIRNQKSQAGVFPGSAHTANFTGEFAFLDYAFVSRFPQQDQLIGNRPVLNILDLKANLVNLKFFYARDVLSLLSSSHGKPLQKVSGVDIPAQGNAILVDEVNFNDSSTDDYQLTESVRIMETTGFGADGVKLFISNFYMLIGNFASSF
jgi:hypothetical protein